MTISEFVDYVILAAAFFGAIYKLWDMFAKPTSKLKKRVNDKRRAEVITILKEELPEMLKKHDLETRDRYKSDRQRYLTEIKDEVLRVVGGDITKNNDTMEALVISAKDVLREKIMAIYHKNKHERTLTEFEREALNQYYIDYKALGGNSYIDKYYKRMENWTVIYDDDPYDEE